jgi:hypothetical protein
MSSGTKLKIAAEEIKDILRKHDIAGAVQLHTPGHGEFILHLNTSYSCAHLIEDGELHIYSKREQYDSKEAQLQQQANTSNMLKLLFDCTMVNASSLRSASILFDKKTRAKHTYKK